MRLYRHKQSRVWFYQWRNERKSLRTKDETAARLAFAKIQRRDADPTYRAPDTSTTIAQALADFVERQRERGRASGTLDMYALHSRTICAVLGGDTPVAHLDAAAWERLVSARTKAGASKSYRWKEVCTLRGALKRLRKLGRYPWALDEVLPDDLQPRYTPGTRHLLMPDVACLLEALPPARRAVVAFVVATGADKASVWRATAADFTAMTIRVRGSKTAARDRVVPRLAIFEALATEAAAGAPYEPWASMRRDLMRAATRAGVGPLDARGGVDGKGRPRRHITVRDLRRSTGRILRAAGVDPSLIGPMLGHAPGSRITAQTYAQVQPGELGALIDRVTAPAKRGRQDR